MIFFCHRSVLYNTPQQVIVALPDEAQIPAVQLGWWQTTEMQTGAFAIDDVLIGPSLYDFGSTYNDTYIIMHCYIITVISYTTTTGLNLVVTQICGGQYRMELM